MKIIGDFKTSVRKALQEIDPMYDSYPGLIICGTHAPTREDMEEQLELLRLARIDQTPTLGICWGIQVMAIEYARNVLKIKGATSEELDEESPNVIVVKLPQLRVGIKDVAGRMESHWHNYRIQEISAFDSAFLIVRSEDIVEQMRLKDHVFYVGVQFHPEYQSSKERPHPLLADFLNICSAV